MRYKIISKLRSAHQKLVAAGKPLPQGTLSFKEADVLLNRLFSGSKPLMIARFGAGELNILVNYFYRKNTFSNTLDYITHKTDYYGWDEMAIDQFCNNAGFFPRDYSLIEKYVELCLEDMKQLDVLGSWLDLEPFFNKQLKTVTKVGLQSLEPYLSPEPFSKQFQNKKVLVIHPYQHTIESQYKKHELLFSDKRVLPDFTLITMKAVQSIAGSDTDYKTWFDALDVMKKQIDAIDFDIAIIGCGAYGFNLAAHVKRKGKQALHLGGATQILFGIKGKRWEDIPEISCLFNEHWVRPSEDEKPKNFVSIEEGCYW
jgi:hypothetical protein